MAQTLLDSNSDKISSFLQDVQYRSLMLNSATFNVSLMKDRKMRLPFFDSQTGIAQVPCRFLMSAHHRMPGIEDGQLYVYPAHRWCRKKRSYLTNSKQVRMEVDQNDPLSTSLDNSLLNGTLLEDNNLYFPGKGDIYGYEENPFVEDELDFSSDNETDETFTARLSQKKKKGGFRMKPGPKPGRGRKKRESSIVVFGDGSDPYDGKPYECTVCGIRYKTRQGLSYHVIHIHKSDVATSGRLLRQGPKPASPSVMNYGGPLHPEFIEESMSASSNSHDALTGLTEFQDNYLESLGAVQKDELRDKVTTSESLEPILPPSHQFPSSNLVSSTSTTPGSRIVEPVFEEREQPTRSVAPISEESNQFSMVPTIEQSNTSVESKVAPPNTYCDFCLGTEVINNKTGRAEELVACGDCGRAGHPTCLQFTENMKISVKQYNWQCMECKSCSYCGTSENDDKLLFCDDCDRGNHLYCLQPPLIDPPEGEWLCKVCIEKFHDGIE